MDQRQQQIRSWSGIKLRKHFDERLYFWGALGILPFGKIVFENTQMWIYHVNMSCQNDLNLCTYIENCEKVQVIWCSSNPTSVNNSNFILIPRCGVTSEGSQSDWPSGTPHGCLKRIKREISWWAGLCELLEQTITQKQEGEKCVFGPHPPPQDRQCQLLVWSHKTNTREKG